MKTITYNAFFCLVACFLFNMNSALAQETKTQTQIKTETGKVKSEEKINGTDQTGKLESLSGINLYQDKQSGNFKLRFNQKLKEDGNLEIKNGTGHVLFATALSTADAYTGKSLDLGKLNSGIYLIEVQSANTTYWKKVRIRN